MPLGVINVTLNKKKIKVFDLKILCSPEMSCRGMVINILGFHTIQSCRLAVEAVERRQS